MQEYQRKFIELALSKGVLKFGSFVLKSGRTSPYFFNAGGFNTGEDLATLGSCYAHAVVDADISFDVLFGPAYKGIPLACATAMALSSEHNRNVPWCCNRKEKKDHGEGGNLVGAPLKGDILPAIIALNRMEKGKGEKSAIAEAEEQIGIKIISIVTFDDLLKYIENDDKLKEHIPAMLEYRKQYGA